MRCHCSWKKEFRKVSTTLSRSVYISIFNFCQQVYDWNNVCVYWPRGTCTAMSGASPNQHKRMWVWPTRSSRELDLELGLKNKQTRERKASDTHKAFNHMGNIIPSFYMWHTLALTYIDKSQIKRSSQNSSSTRTNSKKHRKPWKRPTWPVRSAASRRLRGRKNPRWPTSWIDIESCSNTPLPEIGSDTSPERDDNETHTVESSPTAAPAPEFIDEEFCRDRLTDYHAFRIRTLDTTWAHCETAKEITSQENLISRIKLLNEEPLSVIEKAAKLSEPQMVQIKKLVDGLVNLKFNDHFEWSLAQIDTKGDNDTSITVFVKYEPRKTVNAILIYRRVRGIFKEDPRPRLPLTHPPPPPPPPPHHLPTHHLPTHPPPPPPPLTHPQPHSTNVVPASVVNSICTMVVRHNFFCLCPQVG